MHRTKFVRRRNVDSIHMKKKQTASKTLKCANLVVRPVKVLGVEVRYPLLVRAHRMAAHEPVQVLPGHRCVQKHNSAMAHHRVRIKVVRAGKKHPIKYQKNT